MVKTLEDRFGRRVEYLRISLTDRCNLRCFYCLPDGTPDFVKSDELLSATELADIVAALARRGLRKVRLTGGEPLLRPDAVDIVAGIAAVPGIKDLAMSTNAMLLKEKAGALHAAGLRRVNISLDSLDPVKFARITGSSLHRRVLSGIHAALDGGMKPVKINIVALPDLDLAELEHFLHWASRLGLHLRFIEEMPFGKAHTRGPDNATIRTRIETIAGSLEALPHDPMTNLLPPYRIPGESWQITFISPVSTPFCETCNRVRLTARGFLKLCLDEDLGIDLKPLVRSGINSHDLGNAIAHSVYYDKPERHHFSDPDFDRRGRSMARVGG
jgi:cyclic pyranopterin phosphate synthase